MLSNRWAVRWLKLLLVVLIAFGVFRFREALLEALAYASTLRGELVLVAALASALLLANGLRIKKLLTGLGGFIRLRDALKAHLASIASIFSMVKMSSSVMVYYLEKKGVLLSQAAAVFAGSLAFGSLTVLVASSLVLGRFGWLSLAGIAGVAGGVWFLERFGHLLPDVWVLRVMRDFSAELRKLATARAFAWMLLPPLVNMTAGTLSLAVLTGAGLVTSLEANLIGLLIMGAAPVPAGIGVYEPLVARHLAASGVPMDVALGGVLTHRLFFLWAPALLGLFFLHTEI